MWRWRTGRAAAVWQSWIGHGLRFLATYFGAMVNDPEPVPLWETYVLVEPVLTLRGPGLLEPPPAHPERLCPDVPLTELELLLEQELGPIASGDDTWRIFADRRKKR